jgi:hypothetical protein
MSAGIAGGRKMPTKYERRTRDKLIERIRELEEENEEVSADRDALIGYACVLESMLRQQDIKLPPKPSILIDTKVSKER